MAALRGKEAAPFGRLSLSLAESDLWAIAGDPERQRQIALAATQADPKSWGAWASLVAAAWGKRGILPAARAYAAWIPQSPDSWNDESIDEGLDMNGRVSVIARSVALSPNSPTFCSNLATWLLRAGEIEEARALGSRLLAVGPETQVAGQRVLMAVEASEARFGAALERGRRTLDSLTRIGSYVDLLLLHGLLQVGLVVGQPRILADDLAGTFLAPEPPRVLRAAFGASVFAQTCALASPDAARTCFVHLRRLLAAHYFEDVMGLPPAYVDGSERFAQGDMKGAAAQWRSLLDGAGANTRWLMNLAPTAFDAAGDPDFAERLDLKNIEEVNGDFHGASLAHVRSARRAAARGDKDRARKLAQQVIDAWSVADMPVPAVAEMKALLVKLR
jgi:hypothetical protein